MEEKIKLSSPLSQWNLLVKRRHALYSRYAKASGLPDAQFWVLYALCTTEKPFSQNAFCDDWCYSKQTVCTAVSNLEKRGLVTLRFAAGSRKTKELVLTREGEMFSRHFIVNLREAEKASLAALSSDELSAFFSLYERILTTLDNQSADLDSIS